jgi:hypothetical protein
MRTFPFVVHTTKYLVGFALLASSFSCGSAEHQAPNQINVERTEIGPDNNLYRHHDIMLELNKSGDVFGVVEPPPILFDLADAEKFSLVSQDPVPASSKTASKAKAATRSPLPDDQLWRNRVYNEANRNRQLVFDRAGIKPKLGATRPAAMGPNRASLLPCQKPLRRRALTRLDGHGKVLKSFRKPGSVN